MLSPQTPQTCGATILQVFAVARDLACHPVTSFSLRKTARFRAASAVPLGPTMTPLQKTLLLAAADEVDGRLSGCLVSDGHILLIILQCHVQPSFSKV
jgi:hypothetical protein